MIKGSMVINRLTGRSGPKSDALISLAVLELQNGHACAATEMIKDEIRNRIFIPLIYKCNTKYYLTK